MSDLSRLADDIRREAELTPKDVALVVAKGAVNIKRDWRERASGIEHAPRYPLSIGYDTEIKSGSISAVIGPEDSGRNQGFLGHVLEFGGAHNAPRNDGGQALDTEDPKFVAAITALGGKRLT